MIMQLPDLHKTNYTVSQKNMPLTDNDNEVKTDSLMSLQRRAVEQRPTWKCESA